MTRPIPAALSLLPFLALLTTPASAATLVVANKAEATVSLIDLSRGEVAATLPTGQGPHEVAVSPDGSLALVSNYGGRVAQGSTLTLIDVPAARVVKTIELGEYRRPHGIEWLDDRHAAVTAESNRALLRVDVEAGKVVATIGTEQEISHMVALGAGGRAFVANIGSGSVSVLDLGKGERVANVATGDGAEGIAATTDGRQVWVTNRAADTITVLDAASLEKVGEIVSKGFPIRARATLKGKVLVTRAQAGDLVIYDAATRAAERTIVFDLKAKNVNGRLFGDRFGDSSVPIGVVIDTAGERAFVAHANADVITEVELATGEVVRELRAGKEPDGMGYTEAKVGSVSK